MKNNKQQLVEALAKKGEAMVKPDDTNLYTGKEAFCTNIYFLPFFFTSPGKMSLTTSGNVPTNSLRIMGVWQKKTLLILR